MAQSPPSRPFASPCSPFPPLRSPRPHLPLLLLLLLLCPSPTRAQFTDSLCSAASSTLVACEVARDNSCPCGSARMERVLYGNHCCEEALFEAEEMVCAPTTNSDWTNKGRWGSWTPWECDAGCNDNSGTDRRSRSCTGKADCEGECTAPKDDPTVDLRPCDPPPKKQWTEWQPLSWSSAACDVECGSGLRRRTRVCEGECHGCWGNAIEARSCVAGAPKQWSTWSGLSACSTSCGEGVRTRTRTCSGCHGTCEGSDRETQPCSAGSFKAWTSWGQWGSCSTSCGSGTRERRRQCIGCRGDCPGSNRQVDACTAGAPRSWTTWGTYGSCSTACGQGTKTRTRSCTGCVGTCSGDASESTACSAGPPKAPGEWGPWAPCSSRCGPGTRARSRVCLGCVGVCDGPLTQAESCNNGAPTSWAPFSPWSNCSATCGPGTQTRTRACEGDCAAACPVGSTEDETRDCQIAEARQFGAWTPWSECSGCGAYGTQRRQRVCTGSCGSACSDGEVDSELRSCDGSTPAQWTAWSDFGPCDAACGAGLRRRVRSCEGECSGTCPLGKGNDVETAPCNATLLATADAWSPWTSCDAVCGSGDRTRLRTCSGGCPSDACPTPDTVQTEAEFCAPAAHGPWSAWTACPTSCGTANVSRTRSCNGLCEGPPAACDLKSEQLEQKLCAAGVPALWMPWRLDGCSDDARVWTRTCQTNCHGTCDGSPQKTEACVWESARVWLGPLLPTASNRLSTSLAEQNLLPRLTSEVEGLLPDGPPALGAVVLGAQLSTGSRRRRRRNALEHVEEGLAVREDSEGALWLAVDVSLYQAHQLSDQLPLRLNVSGALAAVVPGQLVVAAEAGGSGTDNPDGGGPAQVTGVVVGMVVAVCCLICCFVLVTRWRRQRQAATKLFGGDAGLAGGSAPSAPAGVAVRDAPQSGGWMRDNPVYRPGSVRAAPGAAGDVGGPKYYYPGLPAGSPDRTQKAEQHYYSEPRFEGQRRRKQRPLPQDVGEYKNAGGLSTGPAEERDYMIPALGKTLPTYAVADDGRRIEQNDYLVPAACGAGAADAAAAQYGAVASRESRRPVAENEYLEPTVQASSRSGRGGAATYLSFGDERHASASSSHSANYLQVGATVSRSPGSEKGNGKGRVGGAPPMVSDA